MSPVVVVIHMFSAVFWFGSVVFLVRFVVPAAQTAGAEGGRVMQNMAAVTRFPAFLAAAAVLTIASGLYLLYAISGHFSGAFFHTGAGTAYAAGGACGVLALVSGAMIPVFARLSPGSDGRNAVLPRIVVVLLACALLAMTIAPFV